MSYKLITINCALTKGSVSCNTCLDFGVGLNLSEFQLKNNYYKF